MIAILCWAFYNNAMQCNTIDFADRGFACRAGFDGCIGLVLFFFPLSRGRRSG